MNELICLLLIPTAYTHTEIRLILAGRATHRQESHIDGLSTSCTPPLRSYN